MDNALRMSGLQRISDLDAQIEHRLDLQWLATNPVPQSLAFEQLHRYEGSSINLVDFIDGADVRVVQRGRSFGFSLKTTESLPSVGEFLRQELQGGVATELEVFRLVHDTHASGAYLAEDAVMRNGLPHGLEELGH